MQSISTIRLSPLLVGERDSYNLPLSSLPRPHQTMTESVLDYMTRLGRAAREASRVIGRASTAQKNRALQAAANALDAARAELAAANEQDLAAGRANGLEPALLERLELTPARIDGMIVGLRQVASLPDPVGAIRDMSYRPSGIQVGKMRTPLGVIGIIYESRPNVTIDAASLCLKSGNATILRGGSEAIHSNRAIATCIQRGLAEAGLPGFEVGIWHGIYAPKGTPADVVAKLSDALTKAVTDPATKKKLEDLGGVVPDAKGASPEALAALVKSENERWIPLLKAKVKQ